MHDDELRRRADLHGVSPGYHDAYGQWRDSPVETLRAVLAAMGIDPADEPSAAPRALVVRPGAPVAVPDGVRGATVALEDGGEAALPDVLPGPLPPGYHALVGPHGRTPLLVVPDRAHLPERLAQGGRMWGVAVQLYAVHGATSWGIGDLADLARLPAALGEPDFLLLNPLHAPAPTAYQQPSPYYAATRRFRNPLAIAIEAIPEATRLAPGERAQLDRLAARGRARSRVASGSTATRSGRSSATRSPCSTPRSAATRRVAPRSTASARATRRSTASRRGACSPRRSRATGAAGRTTSAIRPAPASRAARRPTPGGSTSSRTCSSCSTSSSPRCRRSASA